jgi:hypothetical protein
MAGDTVTLEGDVRAGEPLLQAVMHNGQRLGGSTALTESRARLEAQVGRLPEVLRSLEGSECPYSVSIAEPLQELAKSR